MMPTNMAAPPHSEEEKRADSSKPGLHRPVLETAYERIRNWYREHPGLNKGSAEYVTASNLLINALQAQASELEMRAVMKEVLAGLLEWGHGQSDGQQTMAAYAQEAVASFGGYSLREAEEAELRRTSSLWPYLSSGRRERQVQSEQPQFPQAVAPPRDSEAVDVGDGDESDDHVSDVAEEEEEETPTSTATEEGGEPLEEEPPAITPLGGAAAASKKARAKKAAPKTAPRKLAKKAVPRKASAPAPAPTTSDTAERASTAETDVPETRAIGMLKVWGVSSGRELRTVSGHNGLVSGVALSIDGRNAVSASYDNTLKVWDVSSGQELRTMTGHWGSITGVALSPDGRIAISASGDRTLKVWDVSSGQELRTLTGHTERINGVALSADGRIVVSASRDRTLKVWDVSSGQELCTLTGHRNQVCGVALSRDGHIAISASGDRTLKVWDVSSGQELRTFTGHSHGLGAVAMSLDGRIAVSASDDQTLKVWNWAAVWSYTPSPDIAMLSRAWRCLRTRGLRSPRLATKR
jgi:hypothetical protein